MLIVISARRIGTNAFRPVTKKEDSYAMGSCDRFGDARSALHGFEDFFRCQHLGVLYADDAEADAVSLGERIPITPLVAFGYMVFVLIYFPCIATLAAIKGESGSWKWAVFAGLYTTALAWLMSFAIYQIGGLFL